MSTTQQHLLVQVRDNIQLFDIDKRIFERLLVTLRHFNLPTQLRVASGWVRDKLLGKECYDIDIALDNMMGTEFVDKVREYLLSIGEDAQGVCVIECSPDQSLHMKTARMRLFDMWIDFQSFGTPEEDAYRRDLTEKEGNEMKKHGTSEKKLQLLRDITGAFRPGVLTALMGEMTLFVGLLNHGVLLVGYVAKGFSILRTTIGLS
ncbi:hypothetical protein RIF29_14661 [Crotalaria pallida]|uniref:Poly A polymerase head domain-containing protein n=1 Tax=Crotalaria pallida TaxID=3830 RepID=A0AAN9FDR6_CROPI